MVAHIYIYTYVKCLLQYIVFILSIGMVPVFLPEIFAYFWYFIVEDAMPATFLIN